MGEIKIFELLEISSYPSKEIFFKYARQSYSWKTKIAILLSRTGKVFEPGH